jgi:predicted nuclease of predicted toxin-antitoxin system
VNDIFIKFYLDEDVDVLVAEMIRSEGFYAISTDEAGRKGQSDRQQFEFAVSQNYTIVTHNRIDFEKLAQEYFTNEETHYGLIISVQRPPQTVAARLLHILNDFTADEMKNQIIYI